MIEIANFQDSGVRGLKQPLQHSSAEHQPAHRLDEIGSVLSHERRVVPGRTVSVVKISPNVFGISHDFSDIDTRDVEMYFRDVS